MRLAIPLVVAIPTTLAAKNGILVRERRAIEAARRINSVMFDKTGTLTRGEPGLVALATNSTLTNDEALKIVAAAERNSEHQLARAVVTAAQEQGLELPEVQHFETLPSRGVKATIGDVTYLADGPRLWEYPGMFRFPMRCSNK